MLKSTDTICLISPHMTNQPSLESINTLPHLHVHTFLRKETKSTHTLQMQSSIIGAMHLFFCIQISCKIDQHTFHLSKCWNYTSTFSDLHSVISEYQQFATYHLQKSPPFIYSTNKHLNSFQVQYFSIHMGICFIGLLPHLDIGGSDCK